MTHLTIVLPPGPSPLSVLPFHALPIQPRWEKGEKVVAKSFKSSTLCRHPSDTNFLPHFVSFYVSRAHQPLTAREDGTGSSDLLGERFTLRVNSSVAMHTLVEATQASPNLMT